VSGCGTVECKLLRGFSRPLLRHEAGDKSPSWIPTPVTTPKMCPRVLNTYTRFRNIYLTAIDYALRPRLRTD
jgi:hypothetical protein